MTDDIVFLPETEAAAQTSNYWNVLIVDDDEEVHNVTRLALQDFCLDGKGINFISAFSGTEAKLILSETENFNIAVILLDVVMETNTAGLDVADYVRTTLDNHFTRIILRTGQPANIPEKEVVLRYDINDYKSKSELTYKQLFISIVTSFRAYDELIIRNKREIELEESKKELIIANRSKELFISRMNHELLTPLNAIIGFSQLQLLNDNGYSESEKTEFNTYIFNASQHLKMLVDDILQLIDMQKTDIKISLAACDLNKLINECVVLVELSAKEKCISISIEKTDLVLYANYERLTQCLVILLSNAIKFNLQNGEILIAIKEVQTSKVEISIQDTGVGIAEIDQKYIYEQFRRLDYAEKQEIQGVGVGLSLIKQLITKMNGEVSLKSSLGKGSTFLLTLPIYTP